MPITGIASVGATTVEREGVPLPPMRVSVALIDDGSHNIVQFWLNINGDWKPTRSIRTLDTARCIANVSTLTIKKYFHLVLINGTYLLLTSMCNFCGLYFLTGNFFLIIVVFHGAFLLDVGKYNLIKLANETCMKY